MIKHSPKNIQMVTYSLLVLQPVSNSGMDNLAERLKSARSRSGLTQQGLAERAGMRQAEISKIENKEIARTTKLAQLARALNCDPYWLATGNGSPEGLPGDPALEIDGRGGNIHGIPVRGASFFEEDGVIVDEEDPSVNGFVLGSGVFNGYALRVKGDRNAPTLRDGQFLIVEPQPAREGDLALLKLKAGPWLLREIIRETDDAFHVDSSAWGARQTIPKSEVSDTELIVAVVSSSKWMGTHY
jgi:transcriptional regulator with XRE-family HTH domain